MMPKTKNTLAALTVAIAAASVWVARDEPRWPSVENLPQSVIASGALAWADAKCDVTLRLRADAPRLMPEDLMRVSAALDIEAARDGRDATCRKALAASKQVAIVAAPIEVPARRLGDDAIALSR